MEINTKKYYRPAKAAELVGAARTTLISACERDEIQRAYTGCGLLLIDVSDAKKWAKKTRKIGPKFKADKSG